MWTSIKATKGIEKTHQLHAVVILYGFIWYVWIMEIWGLTFVHGLSYMEVMCSYDLLQVCLRYLQKICICVLYMHRSDTFYRPFFVKCVLYSWLSQWLTCKLLRVILSRKNMKLKLLSHGPLVRSLMLPRRAGEGDDGRNSGDHLGCATNLIAFLITQYV